MSRQPLTPDQLGEQPGQPSLTSPTTLEALLAFKPATAANAGVTTQSNMGANASPVQAPADGASKAPVERDAAAFGPLPFEPPPPALKPAGLSSASADARSFSAGFSGSGEGSNGQLLFIHAGTPESVLAQAWMQRMLDGAQLHTARFQDGVTAQIQQYMPHAVFIGFDPTSLEAASQLAAELQTSHPHLPRMAVGRTQYPQCMLAALRAGVQDFLDVDGPIQATQQTIRELIKRGPPTPTGIPSAPLTAVLSARAGMGSSLLASHLAWYLQQHLQKSSSAQAAGSGKAGSHTVAPDDAGEQVLDNLLVDLGSPSGDCAMYLNTPTEFDFIEAVNNVRRFDQRLASSGLARHESGLRLLSLPRQQGLLRDISYSDVDALLLLLRQYFRHVVADLGSVTQTNLAMRVAQRATQIWVVCDQSVASVVSTTELLQQLDAQQVPRERLQLIINRHDSHLELDAQQIARQLQLPLLAIIPERRRELTQAVNQGQLLPAAQKREPYVQALEKLTSALLASHHPDVAQTDAQATGALARFIQSIRRS